MFSKYQYLYDCVMTNRLLYILLYVYHCFIRAIFKSCISIGVPAKLSYLHVYSRYCEIILLLYRIWVILYRNCDIWIEHMRAVNKWRCYTLILLYSWDKIKKARWLSKKAVPKQQSHFSRVRIRHRTKNGKEHKGGETRGGTCKTWNDNKLMGKFLLIKTKVEILYTIIFSLTSMIVPIKWIYNEYVGQQLCFFVYLTLFINMSLITNVILKYLFFIFLLLIFNKFYSRNNFD
jgi:hypothetical protein